VGDYNEAPSEENLREIRAAFDEKFGEGAWLSTPGNHEVRWVEDEPTDLNWYMDIIGPVNDSRVVNGDTFIALNSAFKTVHEEDWAWLEMELAAAADRDGRTFVMTHIPCVDSIPPEENEEDHGMPDKDSTLFIELMEEYDVSVVFHSHTHGYETWERNGIVYVGTGGGGSPKDEKQEQYEYVKVFVGEVIRVERVPILPVVPEQIPKS
jgi:3',5'-cyclic AMP phosphodiesterase CpdA